MEDLKRFVFKMYDFSFLEAIKDNDVVPGPFDKTQAEAMLADFLAEHGGKASHETVIPDLCAHPGGRRILLAVFGNSPFLSRLVFRDPLFLAKLSLQGPENSMAETSRDLKELAQADLFQEELGRRLRRLRGQAALTIAVADITGYWELPQVLQALSDFAQAVLQCVVDALLRAHARTGDVLLADPARPSHGCGYTIIAMGKLGSRELNYSSDIDLIVLYDPDRSSYAGKRDVQDFQVRFTRTLVRLLQDFTEDGYVFRVDLRLRPDPSSTPIALPAGAAETYYESAGKGWERSAMIKARAVAGDIELGEQFLKNISPFVWRRNLDYAAIRDVQDMIGLIRAHHGHGEIQIAGHNIKQGIGGIREIEFYAQTHQLISGGRDRQLREPSTLGMIKVLQEKGLLDEQAAGLLRNAYVFLRVLEHRLQMTHDEQTQTLPKDPVEFARLGNFMGFPDHQEFTRTVRRHLENAAAQFQKLMALENGGAPDKQKAAPQALSEDFLQGLGFADSKRAFTITETWRSFRYRAMRSPRAQELLNQLTPEILNALAATSDPDGALLRFDEFLAALPAGVQIFSLFTANPWLLRLLAEIMGMAPGLAQILGRRPALLDAVLSPGFLDDFPGEAELAKDLEYALEAAQDFQDVLDITRRWVNERKFQAGVQLLRHLLDGAAAGKALSRIATTLIRTLLPRVEDEFALKHGRVPDAAMAVIAMGKLGGEELTFTSDLDLIFIYPDTQEMSDGKSPLGAAQYFARLGQRFINALTALTPEGQLYEVDMRLRPSGGKGPIAVSLEAFRRYHEELAQTWEHMAWTRARILTGPEQLTADINRITHGFLRRKRDVASLAHDVAVMRGKVDREFHSDNIWDLKYVRGGMIDAEFTTQFLILNYAVEFEDVLHTNIISALERLRSHQALSEAGAEDFGAPLSLLRDLQQITRLCLDEPRAVPAAPHAFRTMLADLFGAADFSALERRITDAERIIFGAYMDIVLRQAGLREEPASDG